MICFKYVFFGNLNVYIYFRYNLNLILWFCILIIYFNMFVICIMINIFFLVESFFVLILVIYGIYGIIIE